MVVLGGLFVKIKFWKKSADQNKNMSMQINKYGTFQKECAIK